MGHNQTTTLQCNTAHPEFLELLKELMDLGVFCRVDGQTSLSIICDTSVYDQAVTMVRSLGEPDPNVVDDEDDEDSGTE